MHTLWDQRRSTDKFLAIGAATLAFVLAYWQNLQLLIQIWWEEDNYSHGFWIVPIALLILWERLKGWEPKSSGVVAPTAWWGWVFLVVFLALRAIAFELNSSWLEAVTILPAIVGLTWSFGSWPLLRRIWPAIAYLVFMLPLPQLLNNGLALPLQLIAATSSRFLLQLSGMWVIQEGNFLNISTSHGMVPLDVARL